MNFYRKNPCKIKEVRINYFEKKNKKTQDIFQNIPEKKSFKAICAVLDYSKPKIFFDDQAWVLTCFQIPPPPLLSPLTILVLLLSC